MYFTVEKFEFDRALQSQINNLFAEYDIAKLGRITPKDARVVLKTLMIDTPVANKLVQKADPEGRGIVKYEAFIDVLRKHYVRVVACNNRVPSWLARR